MKLLYSFILIFTISLIPSISFAKKNIFITNHIHLLKVTHKKVKVHYNGIVLRIPKREVSQEGKIDTIKVRRYCEVYYKGYKDASTFTDMGKPGFAGFILPGVSTLWTTIFKHADPRDNINLQRFGKNNDLLDDPLYRMAYNKRTRDKIRGAQIEGTGYLVGGAALIVGYLAYKSWEMNNED
ncbi:hypothetical protein OAT16_06655 [Prolixibacteraceae bacterium]|nr:hypothetical protein [Prolixibacteraceae bacterium]